MYIYIYSNQNLNKININIYIYTYVYMEFFRNMPNHHCRTPGARSLPRPSPAHGKFFRAGSSIKLSLTISWKPGASKFLVSYRSCGFWDLESVVFRFGSLSRPGFL